MNRTRMKNTRPIWQVKQRIKYFITKFCGVFHNDVRKLMYRGSNFTIKSFLSVPEIHFCAFLWRVKRGFWILSHTYAVGKSQTLKEMWNFACVHSECDLPATPSLPANTPAVLSWPLARLVCLKGCLSPWSYLTPPTRNVHLVLALPEKEKLKSHHLSLNFLCNDLNDSERQQHEATPGGLLLTRELKLITRKQQSNRCNKCLPVYEDAEDCHADDTEGQEVQYIS